MSYPPRFLKDLKSLGFQTLLLSKAVKKQWAISDETPELLFFDKTGALAFRSKGRQDCADLANRIQ